MSFFAECSGLHTNLQKSVIAPIACTSAHIQLVKDLFPAQIANFPIQYLGLPLTVGHLRKAHLQPLVDEVSGINPNLEGQPDEQGRKTDNGEIGDVLQMHPRHDLHQNPGVDIQRGRQEEAWIPMGGGGDRGRRPMLGRLAGCVSPTGVRRPGHI